MEPENRGFIDTATSIAQTTASAVKTVTNAISGNYVGAVISAAQSPFFRKLVACICAFIIFLIIVVCSLPTMLWNALMGGDSAYTEAQLRILNMASQINAVFLDDYNIELQELKEMGVATGDITTNEPVPPISPYKIMAYYSVASLNKNNETDDSPSVDDTADTPDVITGGIRIGTSPLSDTVEAYRSTVKSAAEKYGIPQYVDILLAMMMQESGGRGNDVMQAAGSGYVYGAVTPSSSIDGGVHYFSECLKKAGCTGTQDWSRLEVAVQSYNYGMGYATWLKKNGYTGWTATNAAQYSNYMVKKYQANGSHISRYGDKQYIPHVFRYYHSSGGTGSAIDKIDIVHLLSVLRDYEGEYYYHKSSGDKYEVIFVTHRDSDFFVNKVFHLTAEQKKTAKSYESIFEQLGNTDFISSDNILGSQAGLDSLPLTNAQVTNYLSIATSTDPKISPARKQVLTVGLSIVGKVGYFWGGKYNGTGWNSNWGKNTLVTASGDHTTGTYQPLGLDCSGFVDWAYRTAGVTNVLQGGGTWHQYNSTTPITAAQLRPGDLGFIVNSSGRTTHVGIYLGKNSSGKRLWVHSQGGTGVSVSTCGFSKFRRVVS